MRPTAWTGGLAALGGVLAASGLAFDAPAAAAGAAGLAALLASRAVLFLWGTAVLADGIEVERRLERPHVRQGEPVGVVTRLTLPAAPGLAASVLDLPPASAVYDPREVRAIGATVRYWVRLPVPGEVFFRGILLETSDRFFAMALPLTAPAYAGGPVPVIAAGAKPPELGLGLGMGEVERDRRSVLRGQGIRSYRPFRPGDDPALVDWKLSAKYGRYFVREPTGQAGGVPLVVVDLPPEGAGGGPEVLSAASGAVEAAVREFGNCSLLVVAGGEVVAFRDRDADLSSLVRLLAVRVGETAFPLYRARAGAVLRARQHEAERGTTAPARRLAAALGANLAAREKTPFEAGVDAALAASGSRDVVLYTSGAGDLSHLALIGAAVRARGRRLRYLLPRLDPATAARLAAYGPVEAL